MRIFLSKKSFTAKPDKSAGMIKTMFNYNLVDISTEELYNKLSNGYFIHPECGSNISNTGKKVNTFKQNMLVQTQVMCIDFDYIISKDGKKIYEYNENEMPDWNDELISKIKYKPTFWIESYSSRIKTDKKEAGNSIHMFYIFNDEITNKENYKKTAVGIIYGLIKSLEQLGYKIPMDKGNPIDKVSTNMFQGFWGSYNKNHGFTGETYFYTDFVDEYKKEYENYIFPKSIKENKELTKEEIDKAIYAASKVNSIDDIDTNKCNYIEHPDDGRFSENEAYKIISFLKHIYGFIDDDVNNDNSLCYKVCNKLLRGHSNHYNTESNFNYNYKRQNVYKERYKDEVYKLIGETGAIPVIKAKDENKDIKTDEIINLNENQYLSDFKDDIIKKCDNSKINMIVSAPGTGKTEFAKSLNGNTMIIELFNSIISSDEKFPENEFIKYKGKNYIKDDIEGKLNVCSCNKIVSRYESDLTYFVDEKLDEWLKTNLNSDQYDKSMELHINTLLKYDNIILDESHLLCLSNYRYDIMGKTVTVLKKLCEIGHTRIIIMTGTPFGESSIFNNLNVIKINKKMINAKHINVVKCHNINSTLLNIINTSLENNKRIFIPVDSENYFETLVEKLVQLGIVKKENCFYFCQPNKDDDEEKSILNTKKVNNKIKILGTSSYMSVGIDIEDKSTEWDIIVINGATMRNLSGIEIEQFSNRHRNQSLNCYYLIPEKTDIDTKPILSESWRRYINIQNRIIISMYKQDPQFINIPLYITNKSNMINDLKVDEDMYNCYIYWKDNGNYISLPYVTINELEKLGWQKSIIDDHNSTKFDIDRKERLNRIKIQGVKEFLQFIYEWNDSGFPIIKMNENLGKYKFTKTEQIDMFLFKKCEVTFSSEYSKNELFSKFLHVREIFSQLSTIEIFKDNLSENGLKLNLSNIDKVIRVYKLLNIYNKNNIWLNIESKLKSFVCGYCGDIRNDNKKEVDEKKDEVISEIFNNLLANDEVEDNDMTSFKYNLKGISDKIEEEFKDGINILLKMHIKKESYLIKENKKPVRVTNYKWVNNALDKYKTK